MLGCPWLRVAQILLHGSTVRCDSALAVATIRVYWMVA